MVKFDDVRKGLKSLSVISVEKVTCVKQDRTLFEGLSFNIQRGSLVHLKGPNGAGKTSLLRIVAGLSEPDGGSVNINALSSPAFIYFGHKLGLNKHLTAVENCLFWAHQFEQFPSSEQLYEFLSEYQLVGLEDVPCGTLSAGQQRRVSLIRTELVQSDIWILDEPYTSLDVDGVAFIQHKIDEFIASGGTVLMTSHQPIMSQHALEEIVLEYCI